MPASSSRAERPEELLKARVRSTVRTYGHARLELEWRLGHLQGTFRPGVGADAWRRLQHALDASPAFTKSFAETVEHMGDGAPGLKRIHDVATEETSWMLKKRLADVDADARGPWSVRASVSMEEAEPAPPSPPPLPYERRKQRWSYAHECWRVDLTRVRGNLPSQADEDRDTYEVELELADTGVLFERTLDWVLDWGWRVVDELCGLMTGEGPAGRATGEGPCPAGRGTESWADMA